MEIRVLEYYIAIVEHKSISRAATVLHISQSTLSRQIMDLEEQLGVTLFNRGRREITLSEDGDFLYQRAKEIIQLATDTEEKIMAGQTLSGTLRIGIGEGQVNHLILSCVQDIMSDNPDVSLDYQTLSADRIFRALDVGLLDFGVIWTNDNISQYDFLELPFTNHWGAVVRSDDPLAKQKELVAKDLRHRQLIIPQQMDVRSDLIKYLNQYVAGSRISATYDMNYNMLAIVRSNIGIALTLDKPEYAQLSDMTFIPLKALAPLKVKLVWKSNRSLSRLSHTFLEKIEASTKH